MSGSIILTKEEFYIIELCRKEYGYSVDIQPKSPIIKKQAIQLMQQILMHHLHNSTLLATLAPQADVLYDDSLFKKVSQVPILYSLEYSGYTPIQFLVEQISKNSEVNFFF